MSILLQIKNDGKIIQSSIQAPIEDGELTNKDYVDNSLNDKFKELHGTNDIHSSGYYLSDSYGNYDALYVLTSKAFGRGNTINSNFSYTMGEGNNLTGNGNGFNNALGYSNTITGSFSTAIGSGIVIKSNNSFASGVDTRCNGNNSQAQNNGTEANAENSSAAGNRTIADQVNQFVVGKFNSINNVNNLFAVGNGLDNDNRSDAFSVYMDGSGQIKTVGDSEYCIINKQYLNNNYINKASLMKFIEDYISENGLTIGQLKLKYNATDDSLDVDKIETTVA